jgi:hypothetical protein
VFRWLINYIKGQTEVQEVPIKDTSQPVSNEILKLREEIVKKNDKIEAPKKKELPKKEVIMNPSDLNNIWMIVVDTTGLVKATRSFNESTGEGNDDAVDARKLGPLGIKTFSFVNAPDINAAKGIFWKTLGANNPAIRRFMPEVARATRVTNFTQIFPLLTRTGVVWNYIGGPRESLPGQQSKLFQTKELAGSDAYGNVSAREYQPAPPQIPDGIETKVNPKEIQLEAADRKVLNSNQSTPAANGGVMDQQQMMQMMMQMMAQMQAMNGGKLPAMPQQPQYTDRSQDISSLSADDIAAIESNKTQLSPEENDPELQKQIAELKSRGGQQIVDFDESIDQRELEKMAKTTRSLVNKSGEEPEAGPPKRGKRI